MNNDQEIILAKISAVYDKPPFVKMETGQMEMILKCVGLGAYYDKYREYLEPYWYNGRFQNPVESYTDRKEAGSAILAVCAAMKIAKTEGQIADLGGFAISSRFDAFAQTFKLTIKRQSSYTIELGSDPAGNIQRILNALASIEKTLPQVERRLETLQQQLAEAKEEVQRPFPQEAELNEKSARLAELNALLDMDEKGDDAALGMDEEVTDSELPAPKREIERSADSVKRPSILAQLHEKQAERMAEPKPQKKKSHDMEL